MTSQREAFEKFCNSTLKEYGRQPNTWESWQSAQAEQASTIAQLQLDKQKLREALEVCKYDCHTGEVIGIAKEALQPESVVKESLTVQKPLSDEEIINIKVNFKPL